MMRRSPPPPSHGFTLIEAVITMLGLAIAATVIISLNGNLFLQATSMRNLQMATQMLQACTNEVWNTRQINGYGGPYNCAYTKAHLSTGFTLNVTTTATTAAPCPNGWQCQQVQISVAPANGTSWAPVTLLFMNY
jgi:Tfp pilus assembly protein PilV